MHSSRTYNMKCDSRKILVPLIAILSAFLAFHMELITGRIVTPVFGGASGIWLVLLICFQAILLVAYSYAFLLHRLPPSYQLLIHKIVLGATLIASIIRMYIYGSILSPITTQNWLGSPLDTYIQLARWLASNLAAPFLLLFSTGILLISWNLNSSKWPHRLFAFSNAGSMLGLLLYPVVTERYAGLRTQAMTWSILFAIVLILYLIVLHESEAISVQTNHTRVTLHGKLTPIAIAAFTAFLLSVTTGLSCENISPAPFLWMLPLSGYLLSFILAFRKKGIPAVPVMVVLTMSALSAICIMHSENIGVIPFLLIINIAFTLICLALHRELALRATVEEIPVYYLLIASGSVVGTLSAVAIPILANSFYQAELIATALMLPILLLATEKTRRSRSILIAFLFILVIPWSAAYIKKLHHGQLASVRNLYGTIRVARQELSNGNSVVKLIHGNVEHGRQYQQGYLKFEATTYYSTNSGLSKAFLMSRDKAGDSFLRIGGIGMGIGTACAYGKKNDSFIFYELNPAVIAVATNPSLFTYLSDTPASVEVRCGDARIRMQEEAANGATNIYDLLIVDAFSSDAIPTHLLTKEAFDLYRHLLKPDGILALHISNFYIDLESAIEPMSRHFGWACQFIQDDGKLPGAKPSLWAILNNNEGNDVTLKQLDIGPEVWTDDFLDILSHVRWKH